MIHEIPLERRTLHGHFSRDLASVLTVDPGDSVRFSTLDAGWHAVPEHQFFDDLDPELDGGHALVGPIEVRGARAGDTLEVRIDTVEVGTWGITFADGEGMIWSLDAGTATATGPAGATVALSPFLGVLGMPPPETGVHSMRAQLTLNLRDDLELRTPVARTGDAWITLAFDEDLDEAAALATGAMIELMVRELGLGAKQALALASVAVDLRVTQVVNGAKGIHAVLRHDAIRI